MKKVQKVLFLSFDVYQCIRILIGPYTCHFVLIEHLILLFVDELNGDFECPGVCSVGRALCRNTSIQKLALIERCGSVH